jgi:hypothetical protein
MDHIHAETLLLFFPRAPGYTLKKKFDVHFKQDGEPPSKAVHPKASGGVQ